MDREALIGELASSMGLGGLKTEETPTDGSWFDKNTGTLYCNGLIITKNVAEEACRYFEALERQYLTDAFENKKLAMFYRCAIEAITMMETEEVKNVTKDMLGGGV